MLTQPTKHSHLSCMLLGLEMSVSPAPPYLGQTCPFGRTRGSHTHKAWPARHSSSCTVNTFPGPHHIWLCIVRWSICPVEWGDPTAISCRLQPQASLVWHPDIWFSSWQFLSAAKFSAVGEWAVLLQGIKRLVPFTSLASFRKLHVSSVLQRSRALQPTCIFPIICWTVWQNVINHKCSQHIRNTNSTYCSRRNIFCQQNSVLVVWGYCINNYQFISAFDWHQTQLFTRR